MQTRFQLLTSPRLALGRAPDATLNQVGKEGRGVATISTILNCAAAMRRAVALARDYAQRREVRECHEARVLGLGREMAIHGALLLGTCRGALWPTALYVLRAGFACGQAFGDRLSNKPLHLATLASMELETRAATHLVFEVADLLGRSECKASNADEDVLLRLLTPVAKVT